jgi:hypothetical protein
MAQLPTLNDVSLQPGKYQPCLALAFRQASRAREPARNRLCLAAFRPPDGAGLRRLNASSNFTAIRRLSWVIAGPKVTIKFCHKQSLKVI